MSTLKFTRSLSVEPDEETHRITLGALKTLVRQAETLGFGSDTPVGIYPTVMGTSEFGISVTES